MSIIVYIHTITFAFLHIDYFLLIKCQFGYYRDQILITNLNKRKKKENMIQLRNSESQRELGESH